eukprot:2492115-Alexandrium_andersonii.AAC.1
MMTTVEQALPPVPLPLPARPRLWFRCRRLGLGNLASENASLLPRLPCRPRRRTRKPGPLIGRTFA